MIGLIKKYPLVFLFALNFILRFSTLFHEHYPLTFCDEDIVSYNAYRIYYDKIWEPGQFLYGGFNYYIPAIVANMYSLLTGIRIELPNFILLGRFIFAVLLPSFFVPILFSAVNLNFKNNRLAWFVALIASFSPMALGLSRYAYPDHYIIFFSTLLLFVCFKMLTLTSEKELKTWVVVAGICIGLAIGVKYYSIFFTLPLVLTFYIRENKFPIKLILFSGAIIIGAFLVTNPFVVTQFGRFLSDFQKNIDNYNKGNLIVHSNFGALMYFKYVFFTSFGILGGLLASLGILKIFKSEKKLLLLLLVFPLFFIIMLGKYKTNIVRNMMPTLPYVFVLQGLGLYYLDTIFKKKSVLLKGVLAFIILAEPFSKVAASLYNDTLTDARIASINWFYENIPLKTPVGYIRGGWGIPIGPKFSITEFNYGEAITEKKCVDYLAIDSWTTGSYGHGKSAFTEMIYSNIHFINAIQYYDYMLPDDPISKITQVLYKYDLIKEFSTGYYGPGVSIYKRKTTCLSENNLN